VLYLTPSSNVFRLDFNDSLSLKSNKLVGALVDIVQPMPKKAQMMSLTWA
jgi:hypothetical protein